MKIIALIHHLAFVGFLYLKELSATPNYLRLTLFNNNVLRGSFVAIPETRAVPRPVPDWMLSRPRDISNMEVFINDHSERYYEATFDTVNTADVVDGQMDPAYIPRRADIRFIIQNWVARDFILYTRPNLSTSRDGSISFPPPTIDTIYIMVLNGDIYSSAMTYRSTAQNAGPALGRPIVSGPLEDAAIVHGHLLGGEAVGSPVFDGRVLGRTGFPDVPLEHVSALFSTGIIYQGQIEEISNRRIPLWLQNEAIRGEMQKAFIRHKSGRHFEAAFVRIISSNQIPHPNSSTNKPMYAEIHFPNEGLTAKNFQLYQQRNYRTTSFWKFKNFPTKNMIYILMPSGNVYSAKLKNWQPMTD